MRFPHKSNRAAAGDDTQGPARRRSSLSNISGSRGGENSRPENSPPGKLPGRFTGSRKRLESKSRYDGQALRGANKADERIGRRKKFPRQVGRSGPVFGHRRHARQRRQSMNFRSQLSQLEMTLTIETNSSPSNSLPVYACGIQGISGTDFDVNLLRYNGLCYSRQDFVRVDR